MPERPKILIVDDRDENLKALRVTLSEVDADVISSNNGNDALTATLHNKFALAILDVQMPGMDGFELADLMQNDSSTKKIPVIFLTANFPGKDKISKGYESGAVDYLVKPYDPFILLTKVNVFLTLHNQSLKLERYGNQLEELVKERTSELDDAVENLKRSNLELERFTTIAAHDLQEPLRRVSSYSQLLEKKYKNEIDEEADEIIDYIVDGASHLQEMILDLHDYIGITQENLKFSTVDLDSVISKVIGRLEEDIRETGTQIVRPVLPKVTGDEKLLNRLLFNILDNSIKFRSKSRPEIKITPTEQDDCLTVEISDNGIGIDPQYSEKVFQIFCTLHPKGKFRGRGTGLSIAKRIVECHGGNIRIEPVPAGGISVFFTLMKSQ